MSIMLVFVIFGIGYYLLKFYDVEGIFGGVVFFVSFLIFMFFVMKIVGGEDVIGVFLFDCFGVKGMFIGMIVVFLVGEIYCRIMKCGW